MQSQKTSELDNDKWGTDVSGCQSGSFLLDMGDSGPGSGSPSHLEPHRPSPTASTGPRACAGPSGQPSPDEVGQSGAFNSLGNEGELLNEELGQA